MQPYVWVGLVVACWAADGRAFATIAYPVRPGIMCVSPQALAILTLPDGDSRTHRAQPGEKDRQIANAGGCIDLLPTMKLAVYRSYHNTSLVALQEDGQVGTVVYRAPNIDLQPPLSVAPDKSDAKTVKHLPVQDEGSYVVGQRFTLAGGDGTIELLQDKRISSSMFNELWRAGDSKKVLETRLSSSVSAHPLLTAHLRLVFDNRLQAQTRDIGYPLATLSPLDANGQAFALRVDKTDKQAGRIAEEKLTPAEHGLTPID